MDESVIYYFGNNREICERNIILQVIFVISIWTIWKEDIKFNVAFTSKLLHRLLLE